MRSPVLVNATTDGVTRPPSLLTITVGVSTSITATTEFVVPRSIPIAFAMTCAPYIAASPLDVRGRPLPHRRAISSQVHALIWCKTQVNVSGFERSEHFRTSGGPAGRVCTLYLELRLLFLAPYFGCSLATCISFFTSKRPGTPRALM